MVWLGGDAVVAVAQGLEQGALVVDPEDVVLAPLLVLLGPDPEALGGPLDGLGLGGQLQRYRVAVPQPKQGRGSLGNRPQVSLSVHGQAAEAGSDIQVDQAPALGRDLRGNPGAAREEQPHQCTEGRAHSALALPPNSAARSCSGSFWATRRLSSRSQA